jgi:hypothetical protein
MILHIMLFLLLGSRNAHMILLLPLSAAVFRILLTSRRRMDRRVRLRKNVHKHHRDLYSSFILLLLRNIQLEHSTSVSPSQK